MPIPTPAELSPFRDSGECHEWAPAVAAAFDLTAESGFFVHDDGSGADHSWCRAADGTIVDSTAQQFGTPELLAPDHPLQARYLSYERDFERCVELDAAAHEMSVAEYKAYQGLD